MLHQTRGIVFHVIDYSDTSVIAKIYTEAFGLQSYIIQGVKKKSSKIRNGLLQPLSLLNLVVYNRQKNDLQRIQEAQLHTPFTSIPFDMMKTSITIFLNEILYKSIKEEEANPNLFEFIFNGMLMLDLKTEAIANFHLVFLLRLTQHLGFFPHGKYTGSYNCFDLQEGRFTDKLPAHPYVITGETCTYFNQLLLASFDQLHDLHIPYAARKAVLENILTYLELHLAWKDPVKSHLVLETIMR